MAKVNLSLDSVRKILAFGSSVDVTMRQLLQLVASCVEAQTPLRRSEKALLNHANETRVRFPQTHAKVKRRVQTDEVKANVVIQAAIGRVLFDDPSLQHDTASAVDGAERVLSGTSFSLIMNMDKLAQPVLCVATLVIIEHLETAKLGSSLKTALSLWRSVRLRAWDASDTLCCLQQLDRVDASLAAQLVN